MKKIRAFFTNLFAGLLPLFGAILGALGGAGHKELRRIYIPFLIMGYAYADTESIFVITIMSMCAALSLGYGIPDATDEGSFIGRFFYNLFHQNHFLADIFTRGTIGLFISLSMISVPIIKKNWLIYGLCSLSIILTNALLSWRNFGSYKLFNKTLSWSETITWGLITLFAMLMIKVGGK